MIPAAGYTPADTVLHRAPAGVKLLGVFVVVTVVLLPRDPRVTAAGAVLVVVLYAVARVPPREAWPILRPLLPFLALVAVFQGLAAGWEVALRVCVQVTVAVLLGGLLTRTTRVSAMLELFERLLRGLRHVGVRPDRAALVLALTVRGIPLVARTWREAREAAAARGVGHRLDLLVVPVIVNVVRSAEAMGEALAARGLD